jgi:hypothetical protein
VSVEKGVDDADSKTMGFREEQATAATDEVGAGEDRLCVGGVRRASDDWLESGAKALDCVDGGRV